MVDGPGRNVVLRQLPGDVFARLRPHLEEVDLELKHLIYEADGPVHAVYFPLTSVISMVTVLDDGEMVEAATVGCEGITGIPTVFGRGVSPYRVLAQVAGSALKMPASVVLAEQKLGDSPLIAAIHGYLNYIVAVLGQNAACNRVHTVESRMARWLLMTHDRVESDGFPMTQEFLGQMLGVQRPTVNIAGSTLQKAGLIRYTRGHITVIDRRGLEAAACECYPHLVKQLERTFADRTTSGAR